MGYYANPDALEIKIFKTEKYGDQNNIQIIIDPLSCSSWSLQVKNHEN